MIQQELHAIQRRCGYLPDDELRALSGRLDVPLHRLHEVASCFPGYRRSPPPPVDVRVCRDMSCHLRGSARLQADLADLAGELGGRAPDGGPRVAVSGVSCLGRCDEAPAITLGHDVFRGLSEAEYAALVRRAAEGEHPAPQRSTRARPDWRIDPYRGREPNYDAVRRLIESRDVESILNAVQSSGLRGMGGARFPTGQKWRGVRNEPGPEKYVVCNADECEPGTFKDRELMRRAPYLLVEGMILAGLCIDAAHGYIYVRHEYEEEIEAVREAIAGAEAMGLCGRDVLGSGRSFPLEVFVSPGGYICGEESALLEAMEDRRAEPRNKPPFPFQNGLYGRPTIINNVETLMWTPAVVLNGGDWYKGQGVNGGEGLWFCSISGDVDRPGVYEVPFGITVGELIDGHAGGMRDGQALKAIATSGPSSGYWPAFLKGEDLPTPDGRKSFREKLSPDGSPFDVRKLPLDYKVLQGLGGMLGAAFVALGERACVVDMAANTTRFFRNESCGKCVPCRLGSEKLVALLAELASGRSSADRLALAGELGPTMVSTSICGLGMVAPNPMLTLLQHFRGEVDEHLRGRCPAGVCLPR